jgi:tRNA1(Val) A37 N6-methylase TrmN6
LRSVARRRRFLHWQPAFPGIWQSWQEATPAGGFDAVIGNPPYVRQEQLAPLKLALKARYAAYDGVADLYV